MSSLQQKNKFSQPRKNVIPLGARDSVNLSYTLSNNEHFWPGTLSVFIDGVLKTSGVDYVEDGTTGFTFIIDGNNGNSMNAPVCQSEEIRLDYYKKPSCL